MRDPARIPNTPSTPPTAAGCLTPDAAFELLSQMQIRLVMALDALLRFEVIGEGEFDSMCDVLDALTLDELVERLEQAMAPRSEGDAP